MLDDAPQPDVALDIHPGYGGACRYEGDYVAGPAELVIEVSATTASYDFGPKLRLYRDAGVQEYLSIVKTGSRIVWRCLQEGGYVELAPGDDGIYRSLVFPGLWLDSNALFSESSAGVLATLQRGLASPEHARFVETLAGRKR